MSDRDPADEVHPCGDSALASSVGKSEAAAPAARVGRRLSELRLLSPCLFGFAFVRAYYDIMASKLAELDVTLPWLGQDIMALGMLPVFAGCIVASRKVLPLYRHREIPIVATLLMLAASALLTVAISLPEQASLLMVASALFAGAGFGISILLWAELQSCSNSFLVVLYVSGSFFLGSCLGWFIEGSSGPRLCAALVMLPLLSLICLRFGFAKTQADALPGGFTGDLKFPWRLVCALGVYELALGFRQGTGSFVGGAFTAGVAVASAAIFLIAYFLSHRFDFTYVYRTPFVLMSCGLLATLVSFSSRNLAADVLISTGYSLMFVLLTILLCDIARRFGISAALLCSIEELVMFASIPGHVLSSVLEQRLFPLFPGSETALLVILSVLVIVASVTLLTDREYSRWGTSLFGMDDLRERRTRQDLLSERCKDLAGRFGLSPREREVLELIVAEKTPPEIERELCIASGTLKSHTRRIYRKFDVHRREDLMAVVSEESLRGKTVAPTTSSDGAKSQDNV